MSFQNPAFRVKRWSLVGMEGMWAKMFDPPTASPPTPDKVAPTNPVPEVMEAAGLLSVKTPHVVERDLMHGLNMPTWDNRPGGMNFMLVREAGNPLAVGTFPGPTVRVPRGVVFHAETQGHGPPPHTIHWHGLEPTPMNDGVGHCSMEIGEYTYQFQPNFIGSYFYHCHRNTVQHFEFGLYGFFVVEPPDAYFATQVAGVPVGCCRDGKRRTAANVTDFPQFQGTFEYNGTTYDKFNANALTAPDPWTGNPALKFATDPHAMTVAYDVEALWVLDDRDSRWSDMAKDARATYPRFGKIPGVNDEFTRNPAQDGFFAFNDFHADYWYVTGVPVAAAKLGTVDANGNPGTGIGTIPEGVVIPPELNGGVVGTQVSINAKVGDTILLRALDAAYNCAEYTFPIDIVVIAWDGRALGVPPYGSYNHAYTIPAGTPFRVSVARRFDALIKSNTPVNDVAVVKFINTRGEQGGTNDLNFDVFTDHNDPKYNPKRPALPEEVLMTVNIPIRINEQPLDLAAPGTVSGAVTGPVGPVAGISVTVAPVSLGGTPIQTVTTDATGRFSAAGLTDGMYEITPSAAGAVFDPLVLRVMINNGQTATANFTAVPPAGTVTLAADPASPQPAGKPVTFTAAATGAETAALLYTFRVRNGSTVVTKTQPQAEPTWIWNTAGVAPATYTVDVSVAPAGGSNAAEAGAEVNFTVAPATAGSITLTADKPSPQSAGSTVTFTAATSAAESFLFEFEASSNGGTTWTTIQNFSPAATCSWNTAATPVALGSYTIKVTVRPAAAGTDPLSDKSATIDFVVASQQGPLGVTLTADYPSPQAPGSTVTFTAAGQGGGGSYEYEFKLGGKKVQRRSANATWAWNTATAAVGTYKVTVSVWSPGGKKPVTEDLTFSLMTGTDVTMAQQAEGTQVTFTTTAPGTNNVYEFWLINPKKKAKKVARYSSNAAWTWDTAGQAPGTYTVQVNVKDAAAKGSRPQAQGNTSVIVN